MFLIEKAFYHQNPHNERFEQWKIVLFAFSGFLKQARKTHGFLIQTTRQMFAATISKQEY